MSTEQLIGITDLPINSLEEDDLAAGIYIEGLTTFIETCQTPMTIALQGDWGTGKTSFINLVNNQLKARSSNGSKRKVESIVFNTWKYSQFNQEQNLSISFLSYIVSQIVGKSMVEVLNETSSRVENEQEKGAASKVFNVLGRLAYSFAGDFMGIATSSLLQGVPNEEASGFQRVTYIDSAEAIEELKGAFEQAVQSSLEESGSDRIVIFIDDLDRLNPVIAVDLLEIIKLFLDVPNCVFVLAVDYGIVSKGVKLKHGDLQMDDDKANSFFDKMIQVPFRVPVEFYQFENFLSENLPDGIAVEELHNIIRYSIGNNPRGMKRLLNSYHLISNIIFNQQDVDFIHEKQYGLLMAVLCMQLAHEPLYDYFCSGAEIETLLLAESEDTVEEALRDIDSFRDHKNLRKHFVFLIELKKFIYGQFIDDLESKEAEEQLLAFLTILSYSTITSEKMTIEDEDFEEVTLSEITNYRHVEHRVETILCDDVVFTKNSIVGRTFEIYDHVISQNRSYIGRLQDYRNLPEMKAAGIESRLILPWLEDLEKDNEARKWIEENASDFFEEKEKYKADLPRRKLPGTDFGIITNYSAIHTVQNLYYILNFLQDPLISEIKIVLKKVRKS